MDTRCTSVPISWTPDATLPCPISWTINASLPQVKHASPHCITLRPKCITPRKNATPAMQNATPSTKNATPSPCRVSIVSKRSRSHTPETPIDTMCQFGVSFFYALKALRRNLSSFLPLQFVLWIEKREGLNPLNRWEGDAVIGDKSFGYWGFVW